MKITVVALDNINNAGDEILKTSTEWLIKQTDISCEVEEKQFDPTEADMGGLKLKYYLSNFLIKVVYHLGMNKDFRNRVVNKLRFLYLIPYWKKALSGTDGVITAIGMIKYRTQAFDCMWTALLETAERIGVSVMISAASVAEVDSSDWRFIRLKKALNYNCVKVITTRDGQEGVERLKKYYIERSDIVVSAAGDPALWIPDVYDVHREKSSKLIGVNLIRDNIFLGYGKTTKPDALKRIYVSFLQGLSDKGMQWELFCNGIEDDYQFGLDILNEMNLEKSEYLVPRPQNATEYVHTVRQFDKVFGARLHSCITSFSLDIPVAGMIWDDKLRLFANSLGLQDYFLEEYDLNANSMLSLFDTIKIDDAILLREELKQKTKNTIDNYLKMCVIENENKNYYLP